MVYVMFFFVNTKNKTNQPSNLWFGFFCCCVFAYVVGFVCKMKVQAKTNPKQKNTKQQQQQQQQQEQMLCKNHSKH